MWCHRWAALYWIGSVWVYGKRLPAQIIGLVLQFMLQRIERLRSTLHWHHNERDGVSNHQLHDWLLNCLFGLRSKKTSKLRVTGRYWPFCAGNSPVTSEFPAQKASNADYVSMWWRHHEKDEDASWYQVIDKLDRAAKHRQQRDTENHTNSLGYFHPLTFLPGPRGPGHPGRLVGFEGRIQWPLGITMTS